MRKSSSTQVFSKKEAWISNIGMGILSISLILLYWMGTHKMILMLGIPILGISYLIKGTIAKTRLDEIKSKRSAKSDEVDRILGRLPNPIKNRNLSLMYNGDFPDIVANPDDYEINIVGLALSGLHKIAEDLNSKYPEKGINEDIKQILTSLSRNWNDRISTKLEGF